MPKIDPILADLTVHQLAYVEDQLSNNEVSPDEEILAGFIEAGLTEPQARHALTYRERYARNMYYSGCTPILAGDRAYRFNPDKGLFELEAPSKAPSVNGGCHE